MPAYEYTVIPAPSRGEKTKGAKSGIERFAATISDTLNDMARDGWEYVRAETLPAEERSGLTSRTTVYHNLLIFRRATAPARAYHPQDTVHEPVRPAPQPEPHPQATPQAPVPQAAAAPAPAAEPEPEPEPVRAPFSQPMRATPKINRVSEPPISAPAPVTPIGPRLGPANR